MSNSLSSLGYAAPSCASARLGHRVPQSASSALFFFRPLIIHNHSYGLFLFPSAFSTARHGLGSIKGLVTAPTGSSYYLSDLSSPYNGFFASDVDDAGARRNNNKFDNISSDDPSLPKFKTSSYSTPLTSPVAIATFSASTTSLDVSSTPYGRDFDSFDNTSDFYGISDHSRSRLNIRQQLGYSHLSKLSYDCSSTLSSHKNDPTSDHKILDTYCDWGKLFHPFYVSPPHCRPKPKRHWRFIEPFGYTVLVHFISEFSFWSPNRNSAKFGRVLSLFTSPGVFIFSDEAHLRS